jgi:hypothetical protein
MVHQPLEPAKRYGSAQELFADPDFGDYMQRFWPRFVQAANNLSLQNGKLALECGKMRERFLIYLLSRFVGEDAQRCDVDDSSIGVVERGKDVIMFGREVSIKTISHGKAGFNQLKISWIEDKAMSIVLQAEWKPEFDLLLCRLKWDAADEGLYYISKQVQESVLLDGGDFLKVSAGYGKGTSLAKEACEALISHPQTLKLPIKMPKENRDENAISQFLDLLYLRA